MTVRELIQLADANSTAVLAGLAAPSVVALAAGPLHGPLRGGEAPWKYVYSALIYAVCIPGTFSASLLAYAFTVTRENLLDASLVVYVAPLIGMAVCLSIMAHNVDFDQVPGFDKIFGLIGLLGLTFLTALLIQKTRIGIVFFGSIGTLLV
ncbi:MAG: hypothetical protein HY553_02105, partial [Elusimicrobia bacterium]|nr:hypothetical protein [Elusimicrobiota bacterium]